VSYSVVIVPALVAVALAEVASVADVGLPAPRARAPGPAAASYRGCLLYDEPGVGHSILVWLMFAVPFVILSKLSWLESVVWWFVLGLISLLIPAVTVGIVQAASRIEWPDLALPPSLAMKPRRESQAPTPAPGRRWSLR
jgi:hypothetical protein